MKGNVRSAEIRPMYQLLPFSCFPQCSSWPGCHPSCLQPLFRGIGASPGDRCPVLPAPLRSYCHSTHRKNICCNGLERLTQPTRKSREQNEPLLSTYTPIVTVPTARHEPSWAAASGSSLHPALGPYN